MTRHFARRGGDEDMGDAPRRSSGSGGTILTIVFGGCAGGALLTLAIMIFIGAIVGMKIREAVRQGQFQVKPNDGGNVPIDEVPIGRPLLKVGADGVARTTIVGGAFDPQFEDKAPQGGHLIGLELAIVNNDSIRSIQPIYLVQGKEVKGTLVGTDKLNVTVKAKKGYAVSALNVNAGLWLDGMSLTFARHANGKLDLKDTYQSNYHGGPGGVRSIHGGNGMSVVGVIGRKSNDNAANGIGLLLK